jgi:antitoxin (DNA-binding transcriptional repressor) of toxin-antitoxin stability system
MRLSEANRGFAAAIKAAKAGDSVILTDHGVPFAMIEPLREASREEEEAIQELIDSGLLQPVRKSGPIREWKWKATRTKAA